MPHICRAFNSAQQRSLRSPHTLELQGEFEALGSPARSIRRRFRLTGAGWQLRASHRQNRVNPFVRTDPFDPYNPCHSHGPCHSENQYNRYNQNGNRNTCCLIALQVFNREVCSSIVMIESREVFASIGAMLTVVSIIPNKVVVRSEPVMVIVGMEGVVRRGWDAGNPRGIPLTC